MKNDGMLAQCEEGVLKRLGRRADEEGMAIVEPADVENLQSTRRRIRVGCQIGKERHTTISRPQFVHRGQRAAKELARFGRRSGLGLSEEVEKAHVNTTEKG